MNRIAFERRLTRIWVKRAGSARTRARGPRRASDEPITSLSSIPFARDSVWESRHILARQQSSSWVSRASANQEQGMVSLTLNMRAMFRKLVARSNSTGEIEYLFN